MKVYNVFINHRTSKVEGSMLASRALIRHWVFRIAPVEGGCIFVRDSHTEQGPSTGVTFATNLGDECVFEFAKAICRQCGVPEVGVEFDGRMVFVEFDGRQVSE